MCNSLKVDPKGRLKIPMTLLTTLKGPGAEFYVTSENGNSVRIYPMRVWNEVEGQLERLCLHNLNNQKFLARVKYFGRAVTMDKQGRLLIPITLRKSAQMKGAVDVLDYVDYLEIWSHARLMNHLKSHPITARDEKTLHQVFSAPRSSWVADWKNKEGPIHGKQRRFGVHRRVQGNSRTQTSHAIRGARTDPTERRRVA
jgi:transcriptional regulator MraZ